MTENTDVQSLKKIYSLYDRFFANMDYACGKGCALCCTTNVTMTTLEGVLILEHWRTHGRDLPLGLLSECAQNPRFQPTLSINHLAALCAEGRDIPDDSADPEAGACPLLLDGICTIYEARPFGCRAMVSLTNCAQSGAADMPDFVLAANNLVLQFIEALDPSGRLGNLADILLALAAPAHQDTRAGRPEHLPLETMAPNRSIPVLMVPPEYRPRMLPLLRTLQQVLQEKIG